MEVVVGVCLRIAILGRVLYYTSMVRTWVGGIAMVQPRTHKGALDDDTVGADDPDPYNSQYRNV